MIIGPKALEVLERLEHSQREQLLAAINDFIVFIDADGVVREVHCESTALERDWSQTWPGRPWRETMGEESVPKLRELLAPGTNLSRRREVSHPQNSGQPDIPVAYVVLPIPEGGWLAFGRDMRAIAEMQQQLVRFQMDKERDYARLRAYESRFRILGDIIDDAVLVVRAEDLEIVEYNAAAKNLLLPPGKRRMSGRQLRELLPGEQAAQIDEVLRMARSSGQPQTCEWLLNGSACQVDAAPFRQEGAYFLILRIRRLSKSEKNPAIRLLRPGATSQAAELFANLPDGIVTTDKDGTITFVNDAALELIELDHADQIIGEPLANWLGRPNVDMGILLGKLRGENRVTSYMTTINGHMGTTSDVEVSAALAGTDGAQLATFVVRDVGNRARQRLPTSDVLPHSAEELTRLVGQVPLKELVRQTTDVIERLCIESALQLTSENRASAAEILGLSRQGLYVKLRRHGIIEDAESCR